MNKCSFLYFGYFLSDNPHDRFAVAAYRACLKMCSFIIKAKTENPTVNKVIKTSDEKLEPMTKI